jgi:YD repeat-containing protein
MTWKLLSIIIFSFSIPAFAIVDMKNANYSNTWVDFNLDGTGYDLKLERTYNSRTLFNGIFGFGWCTNFETKLDVTGENNLKVKECGAGAELVFSQREINKQDVEKTVDFIITKMKAEKVAGRTDDFYKKKREELFEYDETRASEAKKYGMVNKLVDGSTFRANGKEVDSIIFKTSYYERTLPDGSKQRFNPQGQLTHMYDKNSNMLKLEYDKAGLLKEVADTNARKLTFKYYPNKKVHQILGPNGLKSEYQYQNTDDLTYSIDSKKFATKYTYDDLHNITKIVFTDGSVVQIKYDQNNDWVIGFTDRDKCVETYNYEVDKKDAKGHFWSTVKKVCGKETVAQSRYEFWHKQKPNGEFILSRVLTKENDDETDISYHETFGRPIAIKKNGDKMSYEYTPDGLVKSKTTANNKLLFEYAVAIKKPTKVTIESFNDKGKKVATRFTKFQYDTKGNLNFAENSDGQKIELSYDNKGRITQIVDQAKKVVKLQYEEKYNKPVVVARPGLGSIKVSYKPNGDINKVDSKEGPSVAMQVASTFNNLLDIIAPATQELFL